MAHLSLANEVAQAQKRVNKVTYVEFTNLDLIEYIENEDYYTKFFLSETLDD